MKLRLIILLVCVMPLELEAQSGREALTQAGTAYHGFFFDDVIRLAGRGLDPSAGPRDSLWVVSLHQLVEALLDSGDQALAGVWLRWAFRLEPTIPIDRINFPPAVTAAFVAARDAVTGSSATSSRTRTIWTWARDSGSDGDGTIRIHEGDVGLTGQISEVAILRPGQNQPLRPGTYSVSVAAAGFLPVSVEVEVLPDVTTVLDFDLEPVEAGYLYVASRPWAEVHIDGQLVGYTTLAAHAVAVGLHRIQLLRSGFAPFDTTITVRTAERIRLGTVELTRR